MKGSLAATLMGSALSVGVAQNQPASSLAALYQELGTCVRRADLPADAAGSEITVMLTLKRDGTLLGVPRITYSRLSGDASAQRSFVASALAALDRCLPVRITDGLGGAVAGRPIRLRIIGPSPRGPAKDV